MNTRLFERDAPLAVESTTGAIDKYPRALVDAQYVARRASAA